MEFSILFKLTDFLVFPFTPDIKNALDFAHNLRMVSNFLIESVIEISEIT